jgi:uncharacterized protein YjbI with pentapeptide repeats
MLAKVCLWGKQIKSHPVITLLIPFLIALILTIIIGGYRLHWAWTGFTGATESYKTLYDWLQLLFVPIALTGFGFFLNYRERKAAERRADKERREDERRAEYEEKAAERRAETERSIAVDNQCEAALQGYINEISELLLHENLRESKPKGEVRTIARVRTLTVLPRLDDKRKGTVLQFLHESGMIARGNSIVDLTGANLRGANLIGALLSNSELSNTDLRNANLSDAVIYRTNFLSTKLREANMRNAHLDNADLGDADLSSADLSKASLRDANLDNANLIGANLYGADLKCANLKFAGLNEANLVETYFREAILKQADLSGADLRKSTLWYADLESASLEQADLRGAELIKQVPEHIVVDKEPANLEKTDLSRANLKGAIVTQEQLKNALSLQGATMPDGSIHP